VGTLAAEAELVPRRPRRIVLRQLGGEVIGHVDHPRRIVDVEADLDVCTR